MSNFLPMKSTIVRLALEEELQTACEETETDENEHNQRQTKVGNSFLTVSCLLAAKMRTKFCSKN